MIKTPAPPKKRPIKIGDHSSILVKKLVDLWYETQMGHYKKCQEKQLEFADKMWNLHKDFYGEE
tara:strand:+ start:2521 stop:2712 length:192 start_codon:yes stop_codon:yes gene_type:complete